MKILMPMAGAGKRFSDAGYRVPKPLIPTTERRDGKQYPMVVCALNDVVPASEQPDLTFVIRTMMKWTSAESSCAIIRMPPLSALIILRRGRPAPAC